MPEHKSFKGEKWKINIDVEDFILNNYTEYTGDSSFLTGPTDKTKRLNEIVKKLQKEELLQVSRED